MTLGDVISKYRNEHGLSMDKLAEQSGISKAYISILERNRTPRGDEPSPSYEMYRSVAKAIGSDVDALIRAVEGNISLAGTKPALSVTPTPDLTPDESDLLRKYRRLDDAAKGRIRHMVDYEYNSIPGSAPNAASKEA